MSGDLLFRTPYVQPKRHPGQEWPYIAESLDKFDPQKFASATNLFAVMRELQSRGRLAPGVDGIHFHDLSHPEWSGVLRQAEKLLLSGDYRPNQLREVEIEKPAGGCRILRIPTVVDRTISRALHCAVKGAWDKRYPSFTPSRYQTFLGLERGLRDSDRRVLMTADITNCFPSVHTDDVLCAHSDVINNPLLLRVIAQVVMGYERRNKLQGLAQGCPYSPTAMEVTLRSVLHAKWQSVPYQWHYVDNFTFLCESPLQGKELIADFGGAIRALGMTLRDTGWADLSRDHHPQVPVLGLCPSWKDGKCRWQIPASQWSRLGRRLAECREYSEPHRAANGRIDGFISSIGPAIHGDAISSLCSKVSNRLKGCGFKRLGEKSIKEALLAARTKWLEYRDRANASPLKPPPPIELIEEDGSLGDSVAPF